jgi:hypothetical protein
VDGSHRRATADRGRRAASLSACATVLVLAALGCGSDTKAARARAYAHEMAQSERQMQPEVHVASLTHLSGTRWRVKLVSQDSVRCYEFDAGKRLELGTSHNVTVTPC